MKPVLLPYFLLLWLLPGGLVQADTDTVDGHVIVIQADSIDREPDVQATSAQVTIIAIDETIPSSSDVSTLVDSASGVRVQRLGGLGDWSAVSIRGSTLRQVQVSLDGIPLNPDGSSTVNLSELPLWAFERVEIYRGNAPPELAASPIGGVINLHSGNRLGGSAASVSYGSFDTLHLTALTQQPGEILNKPADVMVVADAFATEGNYTFFSDNGTEYNTGDDGYFERGNNDKRQFNAHARVRVGHPDFRVTLLESFLSREEGLPGHANSPTSATRLFTQRSLSALALDVSRGPIRIQNQAWFIHRDELFDDRDGEIGTGNQWSSSQFSSLGFSSNSKWILGKYSVPAFTVALRQDRYQSTNLLIDETNEGSQRRSLSTALSADFFAWDERLTLSPVAQMMILDNRYLGDVGSDDTDESLEVDSFFTGFTPRLGGLFSPNGHVAFKANVGRYLRPPDFTELFGDRGAIIGNADLRPEEGWQWDVGIRLILPEGGPVHGSVEVAQFWNSVNGLIVMVQNAQRTMVPINLDDAWIQGTEGAMTLKWGVFESQSNLTHTHSVNLSTEEQYASKQLPRIPTWQAYQRTSIAFEDRFRLGHTYSYTNGNYWDRTNWYLSTPRSIHGVFLRAKPQPNWPSIELSILNLRNRIVEEVPRNPLDPSDETMVTQNITDFVGYPLPGRTALLTLHWEQHPPN